MSKGELQDYTTKIIKAKKKVARILQKNLLLNGTGFEGDPEVLMHLQQKEDLYDEILTDIRHHYPYLSQALSPDASPRSPTKKTSKLALKKFKKESLKLMPIIEDDDSSRQPPFPRRFSPVPSIFEQRSASMPH